MPLPSTGLITLSAVAIEFRQPIDSVVDLDQYVRNGSFVKSVPKNMNVPEIPPIGLGDLHNARFYFMHATFNATNEAVYQDTMDGTFSVTLSGVSNNYTIKLGNTTTKLLTNGTKTFNNLMAGTYDLLIADDENLTAYNFKATIGASKIAADLVFNLTNTATLLSWNSGQREGPGFGPRLIDARPYLSEPYPASLSLAISVGQSDAIVNGTYLGASGNNSSATFYPNASLTNGQFTFQARNRGWGGQSASIVAYLPRSVVIGAEETVMQEISWSASIDGSDYFTFNNNTLTITHRNWQAPSRTTVHYKTWIPRTGLVLQQGSYTTPSSLGTFKLPFSVLKTSNVQTSTSGRSAAYFTKVPNVQNNYTIQAIADDDGPKAASGYSFRITLTRLGRFDKAPLSLVADLKNKPYSFQTLHVLG